MGKYIQFDYEEINDDESLDQFYEELEDTDREKDSKRKKKMSEYVGYYD